MHKDHRKRVLSVFKDQPESLLYIKGAEVMHRYNTDFEYLFRQESRFLYLTGVNEPGMAAFLHCGSGEFILVIPRRDTQYAVWMGYVLPPESYLNSVQADRVLFEDEVSSWLQTLKPETIHVLPGQQAPLEQLGYHTESGILDDAITWSRVIKTPYEIDRLKQAALVANQAHELVMGTAKSGMFEYELKALFEYHAARHGMMHAPYNGIFASGPGSAILHYTGYQRQLSEGELLLIDAGAECDGYAADITRTIPVNGHFNDIQADLYDITLQAQLAALRMAEPGKKMEDLHLAAARTIVEGLLNIGLLKGTADALMENNVFALFFPHGLGHFLGLDTHDPGGYPKGTEKIDRPGLRFLRTRRTLEPGMVITIEPGVYFIPALLMPALENSDYKNFLNKPYIERLYQFGGIRIEDNILITENGFDNLTTVAKTREQIEQVMA